LSELDDGELDEQKYVHKRQEFYFAGTYEKVTNWAN